MEVNVYQYMEVNAYQYKELSVYQYWEVNAYQYKVLLVVLCSHSYRHTLPSAGQVLWYDYGLDRVDISSHHPYKCLRDKLQTGN